MTIRVITRRRNVIDNIRVNNALFYIDIKLIMKAIKSHFHAVQSLDLKFTGVVQIKCTSGQVRVQNLCKQIED